MDNEREIKLIKNFILGDEQSFNELVKQFQKSIYWQARRMVGNHFDADEVTQQVIIVLYKKLETFKFNSSLQTWIYKITQTRCLNLIKKRKIRKIFSLEDKSVRNLKLKDDIISNVEEKEKLNELNNVLNNLPIRQREVFIFRHFEGLSYKEISEITGKSVGGLKANYFHAAKKIFGMVKYE